MHSFTGSIVIQRLLALHNQQDAVESREGKEPIAGKGTEVLRNPNKNETRCAMSKAKVYFTEEITSGAMIRMYEAAGRKLEGRIAVKIHSGEVGNQNFLRPDFMEPVIRHVNGTIVECNTAYKGKRNTTREHIRTLKLHGWMDIARVDILDAIDQLVLPVMNGKRLRRNFVGSGMKNYDSMLVLSHFKGHPMGGFGGALKNISIGLASSRGKAYIHGAGDLEKAWSAEQNSFLESMADAAKTIMEYYDGRIVFVNVMKNLSVDCDCCAVAEDPAMADIGILSSLDPVALDQACLDLVYASKDPGREHLIERIESRNGVHTIEAAAELGVGSREYELVRLN